MIICMENLGDGIHWWKNHTWGTDLGNSDYEFIYKNRAAGLTEIWWDATVDRLATWRAFRGREGNNSKLKIRHAGLNVLSQMEEQYRQIRTITAREPKIEDVSWEDVGSLFDLAFRIKWPERRIASPVFASKLSHFIFPRIFPVVDTLATGYFEYEFLWRGLQTEWLQFPDQAKAKAKVRESMKVISEPELYPFETRIIELCLIGYSHPRRISAVGQGDAQN